MKWISVKEKLPPKSFLESDDENVPYEAKMLLLYYEPDSADGAFITSGIYTEVDLSPYANIPKWEAYVKTDMDTYWVEINEPDYWMLFPELSKENE